MTNFCAGRYEADILPLKEAFGAVGIDMAECLCILMDVSADRVQVCGKRAIIGVSREFGYNLLWHVSGCNAISGLLAWKGDRNACLQTKTSYTVAPSSQTRNALSICHRPKIYNSSAPAPRKDVFPKHPLRAATKAHQETAPID